MILRLKSTQQISPNYTSSQVLQSVISAQEMLGISHQISRDFSPTAPKPENSEKITLSKQDLLEISQNISLYYAPKNASSIQDLTLLAINPQHFYIHWNLGENNSHLLLPAMLNDELVLRIYAQSETKADQVNSIPIVELLVHNIQQQKKITIPFTDNQTVYSAYIGRCNAEDKFNSLIKSNILHISSGNTAPSHSNEYIKAVSDDIFFEPMKMPNTTKSHYASSNRSAQGIKDPSK